MHRRSRLLIVSKFRLSGEALRACLLDGEIFSVVLSICSDVEVLPSDYLPEVVLLSCEDCDPLCSAIVNANRRWGAKLMVVARSPRVDRQVEWLKAGALGVVDEAESDPERLRCAIRHVLDGEVWASRSLLSRVVFSAVGERPTGAGLLTVRECEVANLVKQGLRNAVIASRLHISERTVKGHLTRIYRKLGVENRTQAVVQLGQSEERTDPNRNEGYDP